MISLINHHLWSGCSEVVISYPEPSLDLQLHLDRPPSASLSRPETPGRNVPQKKTSGRTRKPSLGICGTIKRGTHQTNVCIYISSYGYIHKHDYICVVSTPLKHISQLGWLFPIHGKIVMFQSPATKLSIYTYYPYIIQRLSIDYPCIIHVLCSSHHQPTRGFPYVSSRGTAASPDPRSLEANCSSVMSTKAPSSAASRT